MAYNPTSAMFKLYFTDGTFITLLNMGTNRPVYQPGEYEFILPNFYIGNIDGTSPEMIKYDSTGNVYHFTQGKLIINNFQINSGSNKALLTYNPDTDELGYTLISDPTISAMPVFQTNTRTGVDGICFNHNTTGTTYSSFGQALALAEYIYDNPPDPTVPPHHTLENIVKRTQNTALYGTTVFYAHKSLSHDLWNCLYWGRSTGGPVTGYNNIKDIIEDFDPEVNPIPDEDPFDPGGNSGTGGGTGDFDGTGDDIDIPSLPTLSAVDAGFITLFNPSISQMQNLANYMWSGFFDIDSFKKIFANPMDCILGLSIVPVSVPNGSTKTVQVGNISTGISMTTAASQYVEVDCGSLNVNEYWGAYLDYDPYTKAEIYLPYIGTHPIAVDDIMKKTVTVKYHVDILSGSCTAYVKCGNSVLYEFIGQCSSSIPISSNDWTNVINGCLSIAASIGTMVASGGASAPMDVPKIAATATNSLKPSIEKSGSMSGTGGMMAVQTPYLILTRPRQALPSSQNYFTGYPSFITEPLGGLSGYTEIEEIRLSGVPATDAEMQEIENLLKEGVIF